MLPIIYKENGGKRIQNPQAETTQDTWGMQAQAACQRWISSEEDDHHHGQETPATLQIKGSQIPRKQNQLLIPFRKKSVKKEAKRKC